MILYSSDNCGPCLVIKNLIKKSRIKGVRVVNIMEHPELVQNGEIKSIPTLVIDGIKIVGLNNIRSFLEI